MTKTPSPRLLDEAAARAYLGGRDPRLIMPPVKLGGRNCWDRVALDRKLDQLFGVSEDIEAADLGRRMEEIGGVRGG